MILRTRGAQRAVQEVPASEHGVCGDSWRRIINLLINLIRGRLLQIHLWIEIASLAGSFDLAPEGSGFNQILGRGPRLPTDNGREGVSIGTPDNRNFSAAASDMQTFPGCFRLPILGARRVCACVLDDIIAAAFSESRETKTAS